MIDDTIFEMVRRIEALERRLMNLEGTKVLFQVLNVNSPAQLTTNQNNYDPGDYDILQLTSNASRDITGIRGGVSGRILQLLNAGSNNIVLVNSSGLSDSENRIYIPGGANLTMSPYGGGGNARTVTLFHNGLGWTLDFRAVP